jgi:hypothetical protein
MYRSIFRLAGDAAFLADGLIDLEIGTTKVSFGKRSESIQVFPRSEMSLRPLGPRRHPRFKTMLIEGLCRLSAGNRTGGSIFRSSTIKTQATLTTA